MRFALFYEIPVPAPWGPDDERLAYQHVIEQAVAADRFGWDAFWTVEHHFLTEFSHCSNPEVLYGAVAALTERIRIGYGVRLICELAEGAFAGVAGPIRPDWDAA